MVLMIIVGNIKRLGFSISTIYDDLIQQQTCFSSQNLAKLPHILSNIWLQFETKLINCIPAIELSGRLVGSRSVMVIVSLVSCLHYFWH